MSQQSKVTDQNIRAITALPTPAELLRTIPHTPTHEATVLRARGEIQRILDGEDDRFLLIIGPCSIHDVKAGREYAERLTALAAEVADTMLIVMRVYFEKPRTSLGWKGLIMDPQLDGTYDLREGIRVAREFLLDVLALGMPTATELLDPITPQYIADLICWSAIGARTTESQTHRQMASGLSMPLGFKNATSGAIMPAVNAVKAATQSQCFFGVSGDGLVSSVTTSGNPYCHLILRGGDDGPNFEPSHVRDAIELLQKNSQRPALMIDASHANCGKDHLRMPAVLRAIIEQVADTPHLTGAMVESNLLPGNQKLGDDPTALTYGQSITDPCIDWETTETLVREAAELLAAGKR